MGPVYVHLSPGQFLSICLGNAGAFALAAILTRGRDGGGVALDFLLWLGIVLNLAVGWLGYLSGREPVKRYPSNQAHNGER